MSLRDVSHSVLPQSTSGFEASRESGQEGASITHSRQGMTGSDGNLRTSLTRAQGKRLGSLVSGTSCLWPSARHEGA